MGLGRMRCRFWGAAVSAAAVSVSSSLSLPPCLDPRAPLGVFDSGLGGLSVLKAVGELLPGEDVLYVADSGFAPYGERPEAEIVERSLAMVGFLVRQGVKAVVVACNTATVVAAAVLRARYGLPIVALEPAIKPAARLSASKVVGVLATTRTLQSASVARLVAQYGQGVDVRLQPCPGWVELVERGELDGPRARALVAQRLQPLLAAGADTLVLGCTHYPFLEPLIRELAGPQVRVLESSHAVARELARRVAHCRHPEHGRRVGRRRFFTTGDPARVGERMGAILGEAVRAEAVGGA